MTQSNSIQKQNKEIGTDRKNKNKQKKFFITNEKGHTSRTRPNALSD
jgi:hypothetical protein